MGGDGTREDLAWHRFDPRREDPEVLRMVKAAGLKPRGRLAQWAAWAGYRFFRARSRRLAAAVV